MQQRTINESFSLQGKGLHTGIHTTITFHPAPVDFGYKLQRVDLEGKPMITACAKNVVHTQRCTLLQVDDVQIATIEHALAALYGCEIDNCLIEVDSPEFPILDGSSTEYVKHILRVGFTEQSKMRTYYEPDKIIEYHDPVSGGFLRITPSDHFSVDVKIAFDSDVLTEQTASLDNLTDFVGDISMCRTFVFIKEIESLLKNGLIKGGDLDNAIVIYDQVIGQDEMDRLADTIGVERRKVNNIGFILNKDLQFPNEPARHKLLDVIGDIALVGKFMKGKITAYCPGHRINNMFARRIVEQINADSVFEMQECFVL